MEYDYENAKFNIYKIEEGVLLEPDNEDYDCYNNVYDKKNAYYDMDIAFMFDYGNAVRYAKKIIESYTEGAYIIVSKIEYDNVYYGQEKEEVLTMIQDILFNNSIESYEDIFLSEDLYSTDNIIYSVCKDRKGKVIENFVKKEGVEKNDEEISSLF